MNSERTDTHERAREALAAGAVDALSAAERAELLAHVEECAECSRDADVYREVAALLLALVPAATPEPERLLRVRTRLLARAASEQRTPTPTLVLPVGQPPAPAATRWSGWLAAAGLAALLVTHHAFHQSVAVGWIVAGVMVTIAAGLGAVTLWQRDRLLVLHRGASPAAGAAPLRWMEAAPPLPWLAVAALMLALLGTGLYAGRVQEGADVLRSRMTTVREERDRAVAELREREQVLAGLAAPSTRVIELAAGSPRAPHGRMFWNPATDRWILFAYDLPPAAQGRVYQLWLVTSGEPVSAGTFAPGADGRARVQAEYDLPPERLRAIAVTEEPAGGVPAPTGPVVIVGEFSA